jgi:hypothetical protein
VRSRLARSLWDAIGKGSTVSLKNEVLIRNVDRILAYLDQRVLSKYRAWDGVGNFFAIDHLELAEAFQVGNLGLKTAGTWLTDIGYLVLLQRRSRV